MQEAGKKTEEDGGGRKIMAAIRQMPGAGWMEIRMVFQNVIILTKMVISWRTQLHRMDIR